MTKQAKWEAFVNIRLESGDRKAVKEVVNNGVDLADLLMWVFERVDDGYKVTFGPDYDTGAVTVSLTGATEDNDNAGLTMTQRHADPLVALVAAQYAHETIAQRDWDAAQWDYREVDW